MGIAFSWGSRTLFQIFTADNVVRGSNLRLIRNPNPHRGRGWRSCSFGFGIFALIMRGPWIWMRCYGIVIRIRVGMIMRMVWKPVDSLGRGKREDGIQPPPSRTLLLFLWRRRRRWASSSWCYSLHLWSGLDCCSLWMNELYNAMRWEKPALLLHIKRGLCKRGGEALILILNWILEGNLKFWRILERRWKLATSEKLSLWNANDWNVNK